jgi:hypothetical protein
MTPLERLFDCHYPDAPGALKRFHELLAEAQLEFDVVGSIREFNTPPQASFPHGMPSFIHYYVYGTPFGTVKKLPVDVSDPAHAFTSDGIGLNMGCPIRLSRALDVLFSLKPEDRKEPLAQIRARKNHFACVEELLWLTLWHEQTEVSRGGELVPQIGGNKVGDVDWFFFSNATPIFLEAKFRPTDWMRNPDCGGEIIDEGFFGKIGHKFPTERSSLRKCIAAITGFAEPGHGDADNSFFALCEKKLLSTPGLDAILYRSLLGPIYVCSLEQDAVAQVFSLIRYPKSGEYPLCYPVFFNRKLREDRGTVKKRARLPEQGRIVYAIVPDNRPIPSFQPQYPYRCRIPKRGSKGEPHFQNVPPFVDPTADKDRNDG